MSGAREDNQILLSHQVTSTPFANGRSDLETMSDVERKHLHHSSFPPSPPFRNRPENTTQSHHRTISDGSLGSNRSYDQLQWASAQSKSSHWKHVRCSPHCTAAEPAYKLLNAVIGRASALGLRTILSVSSIKVKEVLRPEVGDDTEDLQSLSPTPLRPDIQSRRSNSSSISDQSSIDTVVPKRLTVDRRLFAYTPPLPSEPKWDRPDYFSLPTLSSTDSASTTIPQHSSQDHLDEYGPFQKSYPGAFDSSSTQYDRLLVEYGSGRRDSSGLLRERIGAGVTSSYSFALGKVASPYASSPIAGKDTPMKTSDQVGSYGSGHLVSKPKPDSSGFLSMLDPGLANTVRHRLPRQIRSMDSTSQTLPVTEAEWSFDEPLAKVLGQVIKEALPRADIKRKGEIKIAEYGCAKDTPHAALKELVRCFRTESGIRKEDQVISVVHQCDNTTDIRALQIAIQTNKSTSYLFSTTNPSHNIFSSFVFSPFGTRAFPSRSIDFGLGGANLSTINTHSPVRHHNSSLVVSQSREKLAEKELLHWLEARAQEMKPGAILLLYFVIQTNSNTLDFYSSSPPLASPLNVSISLPGSPTTESPLHARQPLRTPPASEYGEPRHGFLHAISKNLAPAIQHLVALGKVRPSVASILLDVPFLPRTFLKIKTTLSKAPGWESIMPEMFDRDTMSDSTSRTDWHSKDEIRQWAEAGVRIHRLKHPAWIAYREGRIDRAAYATRVSTYCRSVYEAHLKQILKDQGKMDGGQSEATVQDLFQILIEKCEMGGLDNLELDVGIVVLRRAEV